MFRREIMKDMISMNREAYDWNVIGRTWLSYFTETRIHDLCKRKKINYK